MKIDVDILGLISEINKFDNVKSILVQVPEGLKTRVLELVTTLEKNYDVILSVEPVWGACDIGDYMADAVSADLIIHLGHSKFTNSKFKVIYWPCYYIIDKEILDDMLSKIEEKFNGKKIAIVGTVQYSKIIRDIESKIKNVEILQTSSTNLNNVKSQILGCNISTIQKIMNNADAVLYVGDGMFHPGAILFEQDTDLYLISPGSDITVAKKDSKFMVKRILLMEKARSATKYGIFVTFKKGQNRIDIARKIKKYLNDNGKEAHILICDQVSYDKVLGMGFDALINTACPRIAYDDYKNYPVPILSSTEGLKLFEKLEVDIDRMH